MNLFRVLAGAGVLTVAAQAQVPVIPAPDHAALLASKDKQAEANKRLAYDFWREVLEAGHLERAEHYLAEGYIQHNPNVPTGRAGFVAFFSQFAKPRHIQDRIQAPLVAITAEGDHVVLSFVSTELDPRDKTKRYTTTHFDLFRIENGKIAEHWDSSRKE